MWQAVRTLFEPFAWYDRARWLTNFGVFSGPIAAALRAGPGERVLDIGCGTGTYSEIVPGDYVGLDPDVRRVRYARRRHGTDRHTFEKGWVGDAYQLFGRKSFHKTLIVNVLHHLGDDECRHLLRLVAELTRGRLVVVDADRARANRWQRILLDRVPGHFIRSEAELGHLVRSEFQILRTTRFTTVSHSVPLFVFVCEPL